MRLRTSRKAFTAVELAAVTAAVVIGGAICSMVLAPGGGAQPTTQPAEKAKQPEVIRTTVDPPGVLRAKEQERKDTQHLQDIIKAFHVWAQHNQDKFPLPSELDKLGTTVAGAAEAKDTTANIFSMLIFTGHVALAETVSPAEVSKNIEECKDFQFDQPKTAVKPANALWDPAFSADFTGDKKGNISYAHLQPAGARRGEWSATFQTVGAVVGNRGPEIKQVDTDANGKSTAVLQNAKSQTLLIHGEKDTWEGFIAYNDGHVAMEKQLLPPKLEAQMLWPTFIDKNAKRQLDCLFYDEPTDPDARNIFLGIFTKSGKEVKDWTAIWD